MIKSRFGLKNSCENNPYAAQNNPCCAVGEGVCELYSLEKNSKTPCLIWYSNSTGYVGASVIILTVNPVMSRERTLLSHHDMDMVGWAPSLCRANAKTLSVAEKNHVGEGQFSRPCPEGYHIWCSHLLFFTLRFVGRAAPDTPNICPVHPILLPQAMVMGCTGRSGVSKSCASVSFTLCLTPKLLSEVVRGVSRVLSSFFPSKQWGLEAY